MPPLSILCYGDSNTWGYRPAGPLDDKRYDSQTRWPKVLQQALGRSADVVENGVNGRTLALDDPDRSWCNGLKELMPVLQAHKPLNWVCIMLGSNDLKTRYKQTVSDMLDNVEKLVKLVKASKTGPIKAGKETSPSVLLIAPPELNPEGLHVFPDYSPEAVEQSKAFNLALEQKAADLKCGFLRLKALKADPRDGLHLSVAKHHLLGHAVADWLWEKSPGLRRAMSRHK